MHNFEIGDVVYYFPTQAGMDDRSFVKVEISHPISPEEDRLIVKVLNIYFGDSTQYWQDYVKVDKRFFRESDIQKKLVIKTVFQNAEKYIR